MPSSSSFKSSVPVTMETATIGGNKKMLENVNKWIPLICAGGAIGVSLFALKELKNTRKELMILKKESTGGGNEELSKRMESMEEQLKTLTDFIKKNNQNTSPKMNNNKGPQIHTGPRVSFSTSVPFPPPGPNKVKESVVINPVPTEINIINENPEEYEEVEVTDDEEEE